MRSRMRESASTDLREPQGLIGDDYNSPLTTIRIPRFGGSVQAAWNAVVSNLLALGGFCACSQSHLLAWNCGSRQLLTRLLRLLGTITGNIQLQDHAVVHQSIDRRRGRHRVLEDRLPTRKRQVAR